MTLDQRITFFQQVLEKMKLKPTYNRMLWLMGMAAVENTKAKNNPLATIWNMASVDPGQTKFNSAGVKNYSTADIGAAATARTLMQTKYYPNIYAALKNDVSPLAPTLNQDALQKEFVTYGGWALYWATVKGKAATSALQEFVKKNYKPILGAGTVLLLFGLVLLLTNNRNA